MSADTELQQATSGQHQARLVLEAELSSDQPSHAYLFHGPPGAGKKTAARAFAAELVALGAEDAATVRRRVLSDAHPDVTWVSPTGAHVMRVEDIAEPVVSAAGRTPFEATRRVFVLEAADTMNDEVANRLLKTLEEPPSYVHLILLADAPDKVLETVSSRCQQVRFDPPSPQRIQAVLEREGFDSAGAQAAARLGLGNQRRARFFASQTGSELIADVGHWVAAMLSGDGAGSEPWRALLDRAETRRSQAEADVNEAARARLELEPQDRQRRSIERSFEEAAKRQGRRARTELLDLGLFLATLYLRDLLCIAEGAEEATLFVDHRTELARGASNLDRVSLRRAIEHCETTRQSLELNVGEELALDSLTFRLAQLFSSAGRAA